MQPLPKTLFPFFLHYLKPQKWLFLFIQIGCLAWSLDHTLWPVVLERMIDTFTNHLGDRSGIFSELSPILMFGAALWIINEIGFRLAGVLWAKFNPILEANVRMSVFDYVQRHSYRYFSNQFAGSLSNKINDLPQSMSRMIQLIAVIFIPVLVAIIISTTLFFFLKPIFAVILLTWITIHMSVCLLSAKRCDHLAHVHAESVSNLSGKIVDSLSNNLNVKLFARFNAEKDYLNIHQNREKEAHRSSLMYIEKIKFILGAFSFLFPGVLMTTFIILSWKNYQITTGEVIFTLNTSWNITMMVWFAGLELPNLFKEIGISKQALSLIQTPHEISDHPDAKELVVTKGEIVFDHVTFYYSKAKALFKDKTLTIHPGERIGLVGFSGSGKTSFINLILRHFEVEYGRILIDGQDISKVTQNSLRNAIAMIPQEPVLFHRTLMENIRYGNPKATDEEVIEACKKAHCHEFVMKMSDGYQTFVGERGLKLSGGQRQRIAIARAILKNAPILILDEATSALDSITERHIQEDLNELMEGRTVIVIAHRLSTIAELDRILVFDNGEVVEEGTHQELIALGKGYADMWHMQAGGFITESEEEEEEEESSNSNP
jgi:ATP-binding cassette subfamily B protein